MLRLFHSKSYSSDEDDDRYTGEDMAEDGEFLHDEDEEEHEIVYHDQYDEVVRASMEPDGHQVVQFDYSVESEDAGELGNSNLYNVLSMEGSLAFEDAEIGTNGAGIDTFETGNDTFETGSSSGLYSDDGMPVDLEDLYTYDDMGRQQKATSSLMRFIQLAREDLAATFKDPKQFQNRHYKKSEEEQNYGDAMDVVPSGSLEMSTEESGSIPATEATHVGSLGSFEGRERVDTGDEVIEFNPEPVLFEGSPRLLSTEERRRKREQKKFNKEQQKKRKKKVHFRCCAHGIIWTSLAFSAGILGVYVSISSHRSAHFVSLDKPMYVAPIYEDVYGIGMFKMEVCYNETVTSLSGCADYDLGARDIEDNMFEVARILASLGVFFGSLMTFVLMSSLCWESINLKPVSFGFLGAYFFQSFAMLFFDTDLCSLYDCRMGPGCALCIGAALCWLVACVAVTRMDNFKRRAIRRRKYLARLARRHRRQLRRKQRKLLRKMNSTDTTKTASIHSGSWAVPSQSMSCYENEENGAHFENEENRDDDDDIKCRYEC